MRLRVAIFLLGLVALGVAFWLPNVVRLLLSGFSSLLVLFPALIIGRRWKRADGTAAFWSVVVGLVATLAIVPFAADFAFVVAFLVALSTFLILGLRRKGDNAMAYA